MTHVVGRVFVAFATGLFVAQGHAAAVRIAQPGVVVEEVSKGSAGEKAGVLAGDVLLAWQRLANPPANPEKAEGTVESVFDWMWVEMEQGPRGTVAVGAERDGKAIALEIPVGDWGLSMRPRLDGESLDAYLKGRTAVNSRQLEQGTTLWDSVVRSAQAAGDMDVAAWIYLQKGNAWAEARRSYEAEKAFTSARSAAEELSNVVAQGVVWEAMGRSLYRQNRLQDAERAFEAAKVIREEASTESLSVARSLNLIGQVAYSRGDLTASEEYHRRALAIRERLAPTSRDHAGSLNNLGVLATDRGDLSRAESFLKRSLAIDRQLGGHNVGVSRTLNNLGNVASNRGELAAAEEYYRQAFAIQEELLPDSLDVARSLSNLGNVARDRGDLATAESYHKRGLAIREKLAPDSVDLARSLNRIGVLARIRGDLETAEAYYGRALAIREKLAPDSLEVADSLNNLGTVFHVRGDLETAEAHYKRAIAIKEKLAPDSPSIAVTLNNVGHVATDRGNLQAARDYHQAALTIDEKLAPDGLATARSLNNLASVTASAGDAPKAEGYFNRALTIRQRLASGSSDEAESLHDLGLLYRKANDRERAADFLRRSIGALEAQVGRLGGSDELRTDFGAQFADYYRNYIDLLVDLNHPTEAFHVLERSRARTLLAMMAERDLVFTGDVPEDLERERKQIAWDYDKTQARLAQLTTATNEAEVLQLLNRLRELRDRQSDIVARIRQQSPRLASLQYPQVLDVKGVQAALDPGTLVLSYSVGKTKSHLFALTPNAGVQVYPLAISDTQLRDDVERFRSLIQRAPLGTMDLTGLVERGRRLYDVLMQPVAQTLAKATRVLVVPDGPLHALPFAALARGVDANATRGRDWQYLVEWKPVHVVVSATVYAELRKARQNRSVTASQKTLIAFGDPTYPASAVSTDEKELDRQDAVVRSMLTRGYRLTPLPATRREVAAIANLYRETADTYFGDAATEERAKGVAKEARYLHFASHGLLDERFPLNSGLALSIPPDVKEGQDNGILQAWEIFERLRIDADLVVLSACETGLGKEMGGEGLVGLTRSFHYAGARSVLASLWSVADDSTAALMTRFYRYLKAGRSKDAALRQAQLDLIRGSVATGEPQAQAPKADAYHPFYWAAFQLNGDGR